MDLKIKDVAELLNVSENDIQQWIAKGEIPSYRINQQFLFSRIEIEDWMLKRKKDVAGSFSFNNKTKQPSPVTQQETRQTGGSNQFSLYRAINRGGVINHVKGKTKVDIIQTTMNQVASELDFDAEVISDLLLDRESLQPTAVGNGVGIPHTRDFLSSQDAVVVAYPEVPIDYGALDGIPVHTLFFLFASDDKRHLHLLAKIAHLSSQKETLDFIRSRPNKEQLLEHIKKWESSIQKVI